MRPVRRRIGLPALAVLAALCVGCAAGTKALDPRNPTFPPLVFSPPEPARATLPGGAPLFLLPDHTVPLVRIYLAFRGGSVYDPSDKAGLAQALGLAWRTGGTEHLSPETVDEELEKRGIELSLNLGSDKGWASLSVLPPDLAKGVEILSQLLFTPAFAPKRVEWALAQVGDGIRREADNPGSLAFRELRRALYRGHPRGVVPTLETLGRVTREDVVAQHRRLLGESSWAVGVVGDFDPEKMAALLGDAIGRLPGAGTGFPVLPAPADPQPRTVVVPRPLPQSSVVTAWLGPDRLSADYYALDLADEILGGGGFQSRLVREIRSNRGLAYSVGSFYDAHPKFGVIGAHVSTKKESTAEVIGLLGGLFREAAEKGFSPDEVRRAKESLQHRHVFRYEDPADLVREAISLFLDGLPADLPRIYLSRISAVSPEAVADVAARHYGGDRGIQVVVGDVAPGDLGLPAGRPVDVVRSP